MVPRENLEESVVRTGGDFPAGGNPCLNAGMVPRENLEESVVRTGGDFPAGGNPCLS